MIVMLVSCDSNTDCNYAFGYMIEQRHAYASQFASHYGEVFL